MDLLRVSDYQTEFWASLLILVNKDKQLRFKVFNF